MKPKPKHQSQSGCLTLYTGTRRQKDCTCSCRFCTQKGKPVEGVPYQGTEEDIKNLLQVLPRLREAYIFGNPDVSVDPEFCNAAAKQFVEAGCKVMFSTSGWGGKHTMEKLLTGIPSSQVEYVSFSVDSLNPKTTKFLKGISLSLDVVEEGIAYCLEKGVPVKIQPTLWDVNQHEVEALIKYFSGKYNIRWFTFHIGSLETYRGSENHHVLAKDIVRIHEEIKRLARIYNLKVKAPKNMLTESEYQQYRETYTTHCTDPNPNDIQVWLTADGPKAAYCSVLPSVHPEKALFSLGEEDWIAPCGHDCLKCPVQNETLGPNFDSDGLIPVCLYYKP